MKKVCFLTPRFSYPENGGDVVLLNDLMHWFKDQGYEVIQITFYEKEQENVPLLPDDKKYNKDRIRYFL